MTKNEKIQIDKSLLEFMITLITSYVPSDRIAELNERLDKLNAGIDLYEKSIVCKD